jgi:hypothetical protein
VNALGAGKLGCNMGKNSAVTTSPKWVRYFTTSTAGDNCLGFRKTETAQTTGNPILVESFIAM